jgi:hypothetical protein
MRSAAASGCCPAFADKRPGALSVDDIRAFVSELAEALEAGELAAKTVNNALVTLVVCLNDAVEDGLIVANPSLRVERLPAAHIEREYLRLHEIPIYLDSCSDLYRPLAEVLIGGGSASPRPWRCASAISSSTTAAA